MHKYHFEYNFYLQTNQNFHAGLKFLTATADINLGFRTYKILYGKD